jgi:hypothetical protein
MGVGQLVPLRVPPERLRERPSETPRTAWACLSARRRQVILDPPGTVNGTSHGNKGGYAPIRRRLTKA